MFRFYPELMFVSEGVGRLNGKFLCAYPSEEKQGCQIFLVTTYQNGKNIPNNHKNTK
jgi:hypothetical protein